MTEELDQLRAERDDWKRDYEAVLVINRSLNALLKSTELVEQDVSK